MKKIFSFLMSNPLTYTLGVLLSYVFYGAVFGISMVPSVYLVYVVSQNLNFSNIINILFLCLTIGVSIYLFFIVALFVFGIVERFLVIGFKPGRYKTTSFTFVRWLIYSGLHILLLNTVLPFMAGSTFSKMFYRILGAKIGKNTFINTKGLHDAYLLEIGDNVVIGGETNISCHIFEGNELILGKIKIGSNTLIGTDCYIMPDVTVGDNCSIGLYSYIRKKRKIEDKSIIMAIPGLPAKKVAELIRDKE